jgi:hypothetical protein
MIEEVVGAWIPMHSIGGPPLAATAASSSLQGAAGVKLSCLNSPSNDQSVSGQVRTSEQLGARPRPGRSHAIAK